MRKPVINILIISMFLLLSSCTSTKNTNYTYWDNCTFERASERSQIFVNAINDQNPLIIYNMLDENSKSQIEEKEFIKRYNDDLTYPYISPLYCYLQSINLHYYDNNGTVACSVASRLIGDTFTFDIIYENGDYYFKAFNDIIDNSYKDKFDNKVIKWI